MACRCNYRLLTSNDPSTIPFLRATCAAIAASRCRALVRGVRSSSCPNRQHFTSLAFPTSPSYQEISRVLPGPYWRSSAVLSGATVPHPDPVPHPQKCPDLDDSRSEEHTSELQSPCNLVCRLLLEKKKKKIIQKTNRKKKKIKKNHI